MSEPHEALRYEDAPPPAPALAALYASVGWTVYAADPEGSARAAAQSTYVLAAWEGERLLGLARALSDEVSVWFLQDLLVHPDHQGRGIGSELLSRCAARFAHVRRGVLLTDAGGADGYYARHHFEDAAALGMRAMVVHRR